MTATTETTTATTFTQVPAKVLFGDIFPEQRGDALFTVRPKTDSVPQENPDYRFDLGDVQTLIAWENSKVRYCRNLMITGPKGCGKSELVFQYAARMGREVFRYSCHERTEFGDLLGGLGIEPDGSTAWNDGPLTVAMRRGAILMVDEVNAARPGTLIGLNGVLDGSESITLPTGEIVKRHPEFRVAVTGNAVMRDDSAAGYKGTNTMNQAFLDRFIVIEKTYLESHVELSLVHQVFDRLLTDPIMNPMGIPAPSPLMKAILAFVSTVRKDHIQGNSEMTISTRGILAMCEFVAMRWNAVLVDPQGELNAIAVKTLFGATSGLEKESLKRTFQIALEAEKVFQAFGKNAPQTTSTATGKNEDKIVILFNPARLGNGGLTHWGYLYAEDRKSVITFNGSITDETFRIVTRERSLNEIAAAHREKVGRGYVHEMRISTRDATRKNVLKDFESLLRTAPKTDPHAVIQYLEECIKNGCLK